MSIKPKVDDQFWFDTSYELIKDSIKRLKEGASRLEKLLLWAFGIYTGSAIFTVEYKNVNEIGILIILSLPYLLLILGYWYTHIAQLPTTVKFDYRSPTQIEKAYITGYEKSKKSLNISKWFTFFGLLSLSVSLMLVFILQNRIRDEIYLNVNRNQTNNTILINGSYPVNKEIQIKLVYFFDNDSIRIEQDTILNSNSGLLFLDYPIYKKTNKIEIETGWSDENYKHKLIKEISMTGNNIN